MTCLPCTRGEHRFCVVGNCDFCPDCKAAREAQPAVEIKIDSAKPRRRAKARVVDTQERAAIPGRTLHQNLTPVPSGPLHIVSESTGKSLCDRELGANWLRSHLVSSEIFPICKNCLRKHEKATTKIPAPTPAQAIQVLQILDRWNRAGQYYHGAAGDHRFQVVYSNPEDNHLPLSSFGVSPFDALCQATTAMQALLELHPRKP